VTDRWFSPVSSTNKNDLHYISEILSKVVFNTITLNLYWVQVIGNPDLTYAMYKWNYSIYLLLAHMRLKFY